MTDFAPKKSDGHPRLLPTAIALVSFASLLLELALTRLFSVVLFYHFAFLAISIALLGLGAGGVFAYIRRPQLAAWSTPRLGAWLCVANALVIVLVLEVVLRLPVSLDLGRRNFAKLTVMYLAAAVPFFFTGLLFALVFAREAARVGLLYGADLVGGSLACLAIVPLLNWIGGPNAVLAAALAMAASAVLWSRMAETRRVRSFAAAITAALVLLIAFNHSGRLIDIVYAKGMRRDRPWMEFARWNAISRVEVNQVGESKYIVIDADASTAIMNVDPKRWAVDQKATPTGTGLPEQSTYNWKRDLMAAAPAVANVLRPRGDYAIIGPGGGVDVLRAVANGSQNVTGIEINPIIATTIMRERYADYAYHLYELPQVHMHVNDGRSWIRSSHAQYDVIQMTLVDTWASTAAGAFALSENNLYTVEAFREYFDHLKPDGIIAITRWEFAKPREALRVVTQEIEALRQMGVERFDGNFIIVSDDALDEDGRPVTVLAKRTPFTNEEVALIFGHLRQNPNLYLVYAPPSEGLTSRDVSDALRVPVQLANLEARAQFSSLIAPEHEAGKLADIRSSSRQQFIEHYPYNISAVSDDAPFFFFTLKTRDVLRDVLSRSGKGMDFRINLGVLVLGMVLVVSCAAVAVFLILPLLLYRGTPVSRRHPEESAAAGDEGPLPPAGLPGIGVLRPPNARPQDDAIDSRRAGESRVLPMSYFVAIGLGYILVEIALIQRFVLFLGHPTYALTVVVFLMLLSSGAGSLASRRWLGRAARLRGALIIVIGGVALLVWLLPRLLPAQVGLPFLPKLFISAAVLAPLGFVMGMPFPTGLRALSERSDAMLTEWAWAMNAAASVLGSVLAMVIAIHLGLSVTLGTGATAYAAAAGFSFAVAPAIRTRPATPASTPIRSA